MLHNNRKPTACENSGGTMGEDRGYVQIYTGNGKGKTTAALGLALRCVGAGYRVYLGQFIKTADTSEAKAIAMLQGGIVHETFGSGRFIMGAPDEDELARARNGLQRAREALHSGQYRLVILDEIIGAMGAGVLAVEEVVQLIRNRPDSVELVLTGRNVPAPILELADLVTEMVPLRHYFDAGVPARTGIEM
ncbi:cob(I)yrinic acid a,c-diamide adenosyltransferase [Desulfurispirillum indicum]|uniref:cob(I)yrinic acid a,c-diamide adenosyltransferase n=1 Tax=Desulfurispirillum indicum TaxID=936456 RepID=UPI001CFB37BA|nr:cob(I)yrinic acid a,c-diamide adenosyltransferase [Desulfurispirillum indicum]UCZ56563.1 cob(I)yrinic acid a,c-diamide adenosyltransferase [Desulfurispirillum indicum]